MLSTGELDRYIAIEIKAETQNTRGDPVPGTATLFANAWAKFDQIKGREQVSGGEKAFAIADGQWTMRYLTGVLNTMQINEGGVIHDIVDIDDTRKREGVLCVYTTLRAAA